MGVVGSLVFSSDYIGVVNEGLRCLINLVVENHTDRAVELVFFSITPE